MTMARPNSLILPTMSYQDKDGSVCDIVGTTETWTKPAKGRTQLWNSFPKASGSGFETFDELKFAIDFYCKFLDKEAKNNEYHAWRCLLRLALSNDKSLPPFSRYLTIKLANTIPDRIFPKDMWTPKGLKKNRYSIAWFAAYDQFGCLRVGAGNDNPVYLMRQPSLLDDIWSFVTNNPVGTGAVVGAVAAPALLPVLGFTAAGVAAGSVAASAQSFFYGAYTCGVFSVLQSAGTGAAAATAAVATGGGIAGGSAGSIFRGKKKKE